MKGIRAIDEIDLKSKRVIIRVDFNCPLNSDGSVADDRRIRETLPTIKYAIEKEAKVILISHLGRPKSKNDTKYSLQGVGEKLAELLNKEILFAHESIGEGVWAIIENMKAGDVLLLENIRFYKEETDNDKNFAIELAKLCDVFISDAFGAVHRRHASTATIADYVKEKGVGFLLKKEIEVLSLVLNNPKKPFCVILGGAKVSDKIDVLERFSKNSDLLIIGGAMAYTFLKAEGYSIGNSLVENDKIELAKKIISRMKTKSANIILPIDHIVVDKLEEGASWEITKDQNIPEGKIGVDIGPKTIELIKNELKDIKMLVWNGPMGVFEISPFDSGTTELAKLISETDIFSVVGGGDSGSAIKKAGVMDKISHVSTGGGAALEFLEGKILPGIASLKE